MSKKLITRFFPILMLLMLALGLSSCAGMQRNSLINSYMESNINSYEYTADFQKVWSSARSLLFNYGFQVRDSGNGYVVETEWADNGSGYMRRYLVTGYPLDNGRSRVEFNYNETDSYGGVRSGRDLQMEQELIQIVEPSEWYRLRQEAEAYAATQMATH